MRRRRRGAGHRWQRQAVRLPIPVWRGRSGSVSLAAPHSAHAIAVIDTELCIGCGQCVSVCPAQAISLNSDGKAVVNTSLCRGCRACVQECPVGAVRMTEAEPVGFE